MNNPQNASYVLGPEYGILNFFLTTLNKSPNIDDTFTFSFIWLLACSNYFSYCYSIAHEMNF